MVSNRYDVIVVGGGPAGTSLAIHLAQNHLNVLLVEQREFPRAKLCGEFISPECFSHFERLGVADEIVSYGPARVTQTTFYSEKGQSVTIPSGWFGSGPALGLSRAAMDSSLLCRAEGLGVTVLQKATATDAITESGVTRGIRVKHSGNELSYFSTLTIDATGRSRFMARKTMPHRRSKPKMVAFKVHLSKTRAAVGACEIYSYRRGYGGISTVEDGLSNLCFIVAAEDVRNCQSSPAAVLKKVVMQNRRAAYVLEPAEVESEWLSVSLESFGRQRRSLMPGLIAIGDAAAFIDPFTGSGILMALESGRLAGEAIVGNLDKLQSSEFLAAVAHDYGRCYRRMFFRRLMFSSLLRGTAFNPRLAELTITACHGSTWLRNQIALGTRSKPRNRTPLRSADK